MIGAAIRPKIIFATPSPHWGTAMSNTTESKDIVIEFLDSIVGECWRELTFEERATEIRRQIRRFGLYFEGTPGQGYFVNRDGDDEWLSFMLFRSVILWVLGKVAEDATM